MDQVNGTTKKKQVLFSIGSYNEKEKRIIKKIATAALFTRPNAPSLQPSHSILKDRPAPQKLKLKPPPLTIVNGENGENGSTVDVVDKPTCPPSVSNSCAPVSKNGPATEKPAHPPKFERRSISLEPEHLRHSGKVALTIAAYEGEPKTPMRMEFLPQRRNSQSSSKASSEEPPPSLENEDEPIGYRLQNELVATLKRSNLKKRNDPSESENGQNELSLEDKQPPPQEETKEEEEEESQIANGSVKKLATVLDQKLTIREST